MKRRILQLAAASLLAAVVGCDAPAGASDGQTTLGRTVETAVPTRPVPDLAGTVAPSATGPWQQAPRGATADGERADRPVDVAVIGDSLTVAAGDEITDRLRGLGLRVVGVDAVEGRRLTRDLEGRPSGLAALRVFPNPAAVEIWVIALGTNDVGAQAPADELSTDIDDLLDSIPDGATVVWVDVYIDKLADASAAFDAQVTDAAVGRGDMVIVDWFNPAQAPGMLVADGVHLTADGRAAFADAIANRVARVAAAIDDQAGDDQAS